MDDYFKKLQVLQDLYDNGRITEEMFNDTVKKLGKAPTLIDKMKEKGMMVQKFGSEGVKTAGKGLPSASGEIAIADRIRQMDEKIPSETTSLQRLNNPKLRKTLKLLGVVGPAIAAMGIGEKAMAGEIGEAATDTADLATDYIPGVGQAKMALRPSELGNAELPQEEMEARNVYNEMVRRSKEGTPINNPSTEKPMLAPEDRVKYEDMQSKFKNVLDRLNKK